MEQDLWVTMMTWFYVGIPDDLLSEDVVPKVLFFMLKVHNSCRKLQEPSGTTQWASEHPTDQSKPLLGCSCAAKRSDRIRAEENFSSHFTTEDPLSVKRSHDERCSEHSLECIHGLVGRNV